MAQKRYNELIPRTLEQRYQFAIITELCVLNAHMEKLIVDNAVIPNATAKLDVAPKPAPRKRAPAKPKSKPVQKKAETKEVKSDEV